MRTLTVIGIGLVLATLFVFGANLVNRSKSGIVLSGNYWFAGLWMLFCCVDFYIGVFRAGYSAKDELGIHLIIFSIPTLAAWWLARWVSH
jgi:hypothetical protein